MGLSKEREVKYMTVGELKEKLKDVPDDLLIVSLEDDMERSGIMKSYPMCKILNCKEEKRKTWDRFDGDDYTYDVFVEDKDGTVEVLWL